MLRWLSSEHEPEHLGGARLNDQQIPFISNLLEDCFLTRWKAVAEKFGADRFKRNLLVTRGLRLTIQKYSPLSAMGKAYSKSKLVRKAKCFSTYLRSTPKLEGRL